eukprot:scaffold44550_cov54-Cyclotella_meneghiniana.AAC.17
MDVTISPFTLNPQHSCAYFILIPFKHPSWLKAAIAAAAFISCSHDSSSNDGWILLAGMCSTDSSTMTAIAAVSKATTDNASRWNNNRWTTHLTPFLIAVGRAYHASSCDKILQSAPPGGGAVRLGRAIFSLLYLLNQQGGYARLAQACVSGESGAAENYLINARD